MSSYFFHKDGQDSYLIAPPPPEFGEMTIQRAMWQAFGLRTDEMTVEDLELKTAMLSAEAADANKKRN